MVCFCSYNNTFLDAEGRMISIPIEDSYLDRDYDLEAIVEASKTNPALRIRQYAGRDIHHVPGNGLSLTLSVTLSDEDYFAYRQARHEGDWSFLGKTILKPFRRPVPLDEIDDDQDD